MAKRYRSGVLKKSDSPLAEFVQEKTKSWDSAMEAFHVQTAI
jgi:hypothetical protein